jgi:hypothetical protein
VSLSIRTIIFQSINGFEALLHTDRTVLAKITKLKISVFQSGFRNLSDIISTNSIALYKQLKGLELCLIQSISDPIFWQGNVMNDPHCGSERAYPNWYAVFDNTDWTRTRWPSPFRLCTCFGRSHNLPLRV